MEANAGQSFGHQINPETTPSPQLGDLVQQLRLDKTYYGRRNADGSCDVWVHEGPRMRLAADGIEESAARDLPLRLDLHNHSPTGFEWGYGGSGPAQLALALLADAVGDEIALVHYQDFKRAFLGGGLGGNWRITADEMRRFVAEQEKGRTQYSTLNVGLSSGRLLRLS